MLTWPFWTIDGPALVGIWQIKCMNQRDGLIDELFVIDITSI